MSMTSLPIVSLLRERMQWHQTRQKLLAENVSNADTPGFRPKDLEAFKPMAAQAGAAGPGIGLERTSAFHIAGTAGTPGQEGRPARRFETRPSGNAVNIDDEMLKVAENQSEYQLAASLYQKSLAMLRAAAGVKGA